MLKQFKSKTILVAIAVFILGGAQAITDGGIIQDPKTTGVILMVISSVQYVLRWLTNKAISDK